MATLVSYGASSSEESDNEQEIRPSKESSKSPKPSVEVKLVEPEAPVRRSYSSTPQGTPADNDDEESRLMAEGGALLSVNNGQPGSSAATPNRDSDNDMDTREELRLPSTPPGECAPDAAKKNFDLFQYKHRFRCDMKQKISQRQDFKNPAIYEKLTNEFDINEYGTNFDPILHGDILFEREDYYDALSEAQAKIVEKEQSKIRKKM